MVVYLFMNGVQSSSLILEKAVEKTVLLQGLFSRCCGIFNHITNCHGIADCPFFSEHFSSILVYELKFKVHSDDVLVKTVL